MQERTRERERPQRTHGEIRCEGGACSDCVCCSNGKDKHEDEEDVFLVTVVIPLD